MQKKLTTEDFWSAENAPRADSGTWLRRLLGERLLSSYSEDWFWDKVVECAGPCPGKRSLEIGSAPGKFSVTLYRKLGCEPFGLEYTAVGAETNRALFAASGINPGNVYEGDFFDDAFIERHREGFDIVMSQGFIEHFNGPADIVRRHLTLLKEGGVLILTIPRLRGLGYLFTQMVAPDLIAKHNLEIMSSKRFGQIFSGLGLQPLYCGLIPGVGIRMHLTSSKRQWVVRWGGYAQIAIDLLQRCLPFRIRSELLSGQLAFIGVKL